MMSILDKYSQIGSRIRAWAKHKGFQGNLEIFIKAVIANQACFDRFYGYITSEQLKAVIQTYSITLSDLIEAKKHGFKVRVSQFHAPQEISAAIFRFFYYTEVHDKMPFGLTPAELYKLFLLMKGDMPNRINIPPPSAHNAFFIFPSHPKRSAIHPWQYYAERLVGHGVHEILLSRKGSRLIVVDDNETAIRILFEGKEANAPKIKGYEELYKKKKASTQVGSLSALYRIANPYGFERTKTTFTINQDGEYLFGLLFGDSKEQIEFREKWEQFKRLTYKGRHIRQPFFRKGRE